MARGDATHPDARDRGARQRPTNDLPDRVRGVDVPTVGGVEHDEEGNERFQQDFGAGKLPAVSAFAAGQYVPARCKPRAGRQQNIVAGRIGFATCPSRGRGSGRGELARWKR